MNRLKLMLFIAGAVLVVSGCGTESNTAFVEQGRGGITPRGGLTSDSQVQQVVVWLEKQGK